eukprot:g6492.t1
MKLTCEIEKPATVPFREQTRSFRGFLSEMYHTRIWLLLLIRWIVFTGLFCFSPHFQTEVTNFFAHRHTHDDLECTGKHSNSHDPPEACKRAHDDVILFSTVRNLLSAFCISLIVGPAIGTWSDMYGRKIFLIISFSINILISLVVQLYLKFGLPLYWYYPAVAIVAGLNGGSVVLAYVSDVITELHRIFAFGLAALTFSLGGASGTLLTLSGLVKDINVASMVMAMCSILATILTVLFLPESLNTDIQIETRESAALQRGKIGWKQSLSFTWNSFTRSVKILFRTKLFRRLALILFIVCLSIEEFAEYSVQYLQEVLGFGTSEQALMTLLGSLTGIFLMTLGSWFLVFAFKASDKLVLVIGTFFVSLAMGMMAIVQANWMAYVASCFFSFWTVVSMAVSSFKANNVKPSEQGAVQGALSAISSVGFGIGPLIFMVFFKIFRSGGLYIPGAPYYFGFGIMTLAFILALTVEQTNNKNAEDAANRDENNDAAHEARPLISQNRPFGQSKNEDISLDP